ncbi:hypothetical protein [Cohnella kolymensis]|uniref:hypothetical protein n=1 Tax=Cohnella kolymensis TaxID=1590652 RepID=UPI000B0C2D67|nr:hypothetical protein [Cohnella kolymensis]
MENISPRRFLVSITGLLKAKKWLYAIFAIGGITMFIIFSSLFLFVRAIGDPRDQAHHQRVGARCAPRLPVPYFVFGRKMDRRK